MDLDARLLLTALVIGIFLAVLGGCDSNIKSVGEVNCDDECDAAVSCEITDIYDFDGETQTWDECIDTCEFVHGEDGLLEDECEELCQIDFMRNGDCDALEDCIGDCWSQG